MQHQELDVSISVVIPIAEGDQSWEDLLSDLSALNQKDEVLCVVTSPATKIAESLKSLPCPSQVIQSPPGRAIQLNRGAQRAAKTFVWFLHCDSRISKSGIEAMGAALAQDPQGFYFYDLRFLKDGPKLMGLTELGTLFRSRILRLPFGDQGFIMSLETFKTLGGFSETAAYGEDHLLVWRAHHMGIKLKTIGASLYTSARRYRVHGWRQTTVYHLKLTIQQAWPQLLKLACARRRP